MSHRKTSLCFLPMLICFGLSAPAASQSKAILNEPLPPGPLQQKASTACLECHEARIILQQRLSKATWTKEVDKMIKWGALVDSNDRDALIEYLSTNFSPEKVPYKPPRSTSDKAPGNGKASR